MKNILLAILMVFIGIAHTSSYTPMCPDWSSSATYVVGDCVSDEGNNYVAVMDIGTYVRPIYHTPSIWKTCNTGECDDKFLYCSDINHYKNDTIYDTTRISVSINDTTHFPISIFDTTHINVVINDTSRVALMVFDTTHITVTTHDTTIINDTILNVFTLYDTVHTKYTLIDTITTTFNTYDTLNITDTIITTVEALDTTYTQIIDTQYVSVLDSFMLRELVHTAVITQENIHTSPILTIKIDTTKTKLDENDVLTIDYDIYVYDNQAQFVNKVKGSDTLYNKGISTNLSIELIMKNSDGKLISNKGRLLGTGVYILRGYSIFTLNGLKETSTQYNDKVGYAR